MCTACNEYPRLFSSEYIQPKKTNCFELTTGNSGVYLFGIERQLNEGGRDFLEQYCEYSTEGTAWTVIQRRDNFEVQENFNRSWVDFKGGFGNLSHDFWFGNDFIHR
jgi:angiopoietin 2